MDEPYFGVQVLVPVFTYNVLVAPPAVLRYNEPIGELSLFEGTPEPVLIWMAVEPTATVPGIVKTPVVPFKVIKFVVDPPVFQIKLLFDPLYTVNTIPVK